jgi:hypothetical protein
VGYVPIETPRETADWLGPHIATYLTPLASIANVETAWPIEACGWWIERIQLLTAQGLPVPPPVLRYALRDNRDKRVHIIDGNHRLASARHVGLYSIACEWRVVGPRQQWEQFRTQAGLVEVSDDYLRACADVRTSIAWHEQKETDYEDAQHALWLAGFEGVDYRWLGRSNRISLNAIETWRRCYVTRSTATGPIAGSGC